MSLKLLKEYKTNIIVSVIASIACFAFLFILIGGLVFFQGDLFTDIITQLGNIGNRGREIPAGTEPVRKDVLAEESLIVDIVEKSNPAVVSIVITKDVPTNGGLFEGFNLFGDDFFYNFFGNPQQRQNGTERQEVGGGSGFFVSDDGLIVTNRHVVDDVEADYTVITNDGQRHEAEVLAKDPVLDIAIIRVKATNLPYLKLGNSDLIKPGQTVIAIGNALAEFHNTVSVGVVSGLYRSIVAGDLYGRSELLEGVIQTDAAINPGNSGGPLIDLAGNVIGVNVAVQQGAQSIGFALPSNTIKGIVDSVIKYGEIIRPYLGVRYLLITDALKERNNLPVNYGALVIRGETMEDLAVIPGSPADKAGIVENDIILEVNGEKIEQGKSLSAMIRKKQVGETVRLKVLHRAQEKEVEAVLERAPSAL